MLCLFFQWLIYEILIAKVSTGATLAERGIEAIGEIPIHGYINDIAIGADGRFCIAAVGQEHRLGRWDRVAKAKNRFTIIKLPESILANDDESSDDGSSGSIKSDNPNDDSS